MFPIKAARQNEYIDYIITDEGGHVGFWSRPGDWLYRTLMNYFTRKFDKLTICDL
jgi:predicted alpha/beta-fold hydrolase